MKVHRRPIWGSTHTNKQTNSQSMAVHQAYVEDMAGGRVVVPTSCSELSSNSSAFLTSHRRTSPPTLIPHFSGT